MGAWLRPWEVRDELTRIDLAIQIGTQGRPEFAVKGIYILPSIITTAANGN